MSCGCMHRAGDRVRQTRVGRQLLRRYGRRIEDDGNRRWLESNWVRNGVDMVLATDYQHPVNGEASRWSG